MHDIDLIYVGRLRPYSLEKQGPTLSLSCFFVSDEKIEKFCNIDPQEDTKKLLQFLCWENPTFSHAVLYELLWQIAVAYTYELRPYIDLLLHILLMEDSWQTLRIQKSLKGIPDDHSAREGLFDTISRCHFYFKRTLGRMPKQLMYFADSRLYIIDSLSWTFCLKAFVMDIVQLHYVLDISSDILSLVTSCVISPRC